MRIVCYCGPRYQRYADDLSSSIKKLGLNYEIIIGSDYEDEKEGTIDRVEEIHHLLNTHGWIMHLHADCLVNRTPDLLMQTGFFSQYDVAVTRRTGDLYDTVCLALHKCPSVNVMMDRWEHEAREAGLTSDHGDVTLTRAIRWSQSNCGLRVYTLPSEYHHIPGMTDIENPVITHFAHRNGPIRSAS